MKAQPAPISITVINRRAPLILKVNKQYNRKVLKEGI